MESKIKVLCFADLGEKLGRSLEIPAETDLTAAELRQRVIKLYPQFQSDLQSCLIAVNQEYATGETMVNTGDEIAFIPPVSGG
ncbi:molybdopterin converting factor subunit 1 [Paenactinomyces guangxiensis]|uniref:Molybdopterin synthase sulfur carrier subunit n=1 Tax=Paenactinomyces guangxiensis TaxID=1490290 RepID=A0A7W1WPT0_9BACL|nr:molybdopterin converting factor subunit 1 [Paenactinomyces guangxiensis]MBA4493807.1 molybdopterin converting factor subunit 1 [Paenactinomyces guangxiensis]MBH8591273.1 molybdopterin converting factor subunit 1 [Paenactinomyces guangxiensis]